MIQPFRDELTRIGFRELRTVEEVDEAMKLQGTNLLVINSVCGCAAGKARPGIALALEKTSVKPDHLTTVFAGGDVEATARVRDEYLKGIPPSSPSIAVFRDGILVHFVPRFQIESRDSVQISEHLLETFRQFCSLTTMPQKAE
jgi:putative YphP/YqiW family bacilliredoxin